MVRVSRKPTSVQSRSPYAFRPSVRRKIISPEANSRVVDEQTRERERRGKAKRTAGTENLGTGSCLAWRFAKQCLLSSRSARQAGREGRKEGRKKKNVQKCFNPPSPPPSSSRCFVVTYRPTIFLLCFSIPASSAFQLFAVSPDFSRLWH